MTHDRETGDRKAGRERVSGADSVEDEKRPSTPGPEAVPSEADLEQDLPGVPGGSTEEDKGDPP